MLHGNAMIGVRDPIDADTLPRVHMPSRRYGRPRRYGRSLWPTRHTAGPDVEPGGRIESVKETLALHTGMRRGEIQSLRWVVR